MSDKTSLALGWKEYSSSYEGSANFSKLMKLRNDKRNHESTFYIYNDKFMCDTSENQYQFDLAIFPEGWTDEELLTLVSSLKSMPFAKNNRIVFHQADEAIEIAKSILNIRHAQNAVTVSKQSRCIASIALLLSILAVGFSYYDYEGDKKWLDQEITLINQTNSEIQNLNKSVSELIIAIREPILSNKKQTPAEKELKNSKGSSSD